MDILALVLSGLVGVMLAVLSVKRYTAYNAGMFDLGNMAQAIWSATKGLPLRFTCEGVQHTRLAFHVELAYFLIAPLYAVFDSPVTLLTLQSALFVAGSLPLYRLTKRKTDSILAARLVVLCYLFYPVANTAVLFDFHGDTLAAPLILFAVEAWDKGRKPWYAFWLALAMSCKFYVAAAVVMLGFVVYVYGAKSTGLWTAVAGLSWGVIAFFVIRPWAVTNLTSGSVLAGTSEAYFSHYYGNIQDVIRLNYLLPRMMTLFFVVGPALWVGHRAPLWWLPIFGIVLPALATSGNVTAYDYRFHHYALVVPFLMFATAYGLEKICHSRRAPELGMQLAITLLFSILLVDTPLTPMFWAGLPGWGMDAWAYGQTSRDRLKDQWLDENIPVDAPLGVSFFIAPHVINRSRLVTLTEPETERDLRTLPSLLDTTDWVVADALFDYDVPSGNWYDGQRGLPFVHRSPIGIGHPAPVTGGVLYDAEAIRVLLQHPGFGLLSARDGLLLFGKKPLLCSSPLTVSLDIRKASGEQKELAARFDDVIGLLNFDIERVADRRFMLSYDWRLLESAGLTNRYFAVTTLEGVPDARFVHLPTQVLYPTSTWRPDEIIREQFEVQVPADAKVGSYQLYVGWHDSDHLFAHLTDERSRLGLETSVGSIELQGP
jgi:uncharacterized membrane protein